MEKRMKYFLAKAIEEEAYGRRKKQDWGEGDLKAWINNSIRAYEKDYNSKTLLRALELSCAGASQPAIKANAESRCEFCGETNCKNAECEDDVW